MYLIFYINHKKKEYFFFNVFCRSPPIKDIRIMFIFCVIAATYFKLRRKSIKSMGLLN